LLHKLSQLLEDVILWEEPHAFPRGEEEIEEDLPPKFIVELLDDLFSKLILFIKFLEYPCKDKCLLDFLNF
jgi:hypothetical protein